LRKKKKFSQARLAELAGVSQATISRLEKEEQKPDLKLLGKIAQALEVELSEIVPEDLLNSLLGQTHQEAFYAFCPNPFCERNETGLNKDGTAFVMWKSGQRHHVERYNEVNFCTRCGTDLVKECPSCKRMLEDQGSRYCISCGSKITERPTEEEWKQITETEKAKADEVDDGIPF
jgi:transcriptional regulator with XRE-family HTH domain